MTPLLWYVLAALVFASWAVFGRVGYLHGRSVVLHDRHLMEQELARHQRHDDTWITNGAGINHRHLADVRTARDEQDRTS